MFTFFIFILVIGLIAWVVYKWSNLVLSFLIKEENKLFKRVENKLIPSKPTKGKVSRKKITGWE